MNTPVKILLIGAAGRMGQAITRLIAQGWAPGAQLIAAVDRAAIAAAARQIPVVLSANTSAGINILLTLVARAAAALKNSGYDCEIIERHHRRKKDAPSGTALALGQAAATALGFGYRP